ncbi:MAG: AraC family transcriptional regulator [Planctomycetota bacterium]|jgi:AraC-like DNA-binding protein|nr:AraC family transcriptional regulator [Planctomycetota bacterium]
MVDFAACTPKIKRTAGSSFLPELTVLGKGTYQPRKPQRQGVRHNGEFWRIGYLSMGRAEWYGAERMYPLATGWLFVVPPGAEFSGIDHVIDRCETFWIGIDGQRLDKLLPGSEALFKRLAKLDQHAFPGDHDLTPYFARLDDEVRLQDRSRESQIRAALSYILAETVRLGEAAPPLAVTSRERKLANTVKSGIPLVDKAAKRIAKDLSQIPYIETVAMELGVTRVHLHRLFKQHVGISPMAYIQQLRLDRARELLLKGDHVSDISLAVGFATTGELRRLFKQALGCQPEQWLLSQARMWPGSGEKQAAKKPAAKKPAAKKPAAKKPAAKKKTAAKKK